jgi:muramoyltetrapeptide carboxypeptidase
LNPLLISQKSHRVKQPNRQDTFMPPATNLRILPIAPSSPFNVEDYLAGVAQLRSQGHFVEDGDLIVQGPFSYLNGDDDTRLVKLQSALDSNDHDLIWAARGGYGLTRILPMVTVVNERRTPLVVGLSDTSALLMHLWSHGRVKSLHASPLISIWRQPPGPTEALTQILSGRARDVVYPTFESLSPSHVAGKIEGTLLAANLCMLTHLIGTSSMPNLDGTILALEEIGERPYRLDRMLTQLLTSGSLVGVKAVLVGHLTQCGEGSPATDGALAVFKERLAAFGIPAFGPIPFGHEPPNWPLPFGVSASIEHRGDTFSLHVHEEILPRA